MTSSIQLVSEPGSVRTARRFVAERLASATSDDLRQSAALCVTELVANVVRHTVSPVCDLSVAWDGRIARIEVHDESPVPPLVADPSEETEGGRGLRIVDALATNWGITACEGNGKAIWVRLT